MKKKSLHITACPSYNRFPGVGKPFLFLLLFSLFSLQKASAQQQPLYSQYMMNEFLINPATAGYDGYTSFNLTSRQQWLGLEDAPSTQSISWQTRILKRGYMIKSRSPKKKVFIPARSGRVGLGASVYSDRHGLIDRTGLQFSYAYHIFIQNTQLSFGLSASAYQFKLNSTSFEPGDQNDNLLRTLNQAIYVPDASFGVFVLNRGFYGGFSVDQLMQSYIKLGNTQKLKSYRLKRIYYATGGFRHILANPDYELEPSFLIKTSENFNLQADISGKLYFEDNYWAGLSYRTDHSIILLGGLKFRRFYAGYAFDYNFSNLTRYTYGSHEIMMALKFGDSARRYRWVHRY